MVYFIILTFGTRFNIINEENNYQFRQATGVYFLRTIILTFKNDIFY